MKIAATENTRAKKKVQVQLKSKTVENLAQNGMKKNIPNPKIIATAPMIIFVIAHFEIAVSAKEQIVCA